MIAPVVSEELAQELAQMRSKLNPSTSKRWTYRELVRWLQDERGIVVSREAVRGAVNRVRMAQRDERVLAMQVVLMQELPKTLRRMATVAKDLELRVAKSKGVKPAVDALDVFRKILIAQADLLGINNAAKGKVKIEGDAETLAAMLSKAFPDDP